MAKLCVSTNLLAEAMAWCQPDGTERLHLQHVYFDRKNMVATDGHRMVIAPMPIASDKLDPFGLHRNDIAALVAFVRANARKDFLLEFDLQVEGKLRKATTKVGSSSITLAMREVGYPPYEQVARHEVNKPPSPDGYTLDATYLAMVNGIVQAGEPKNGSSGPGVRIVSWGAPVPSYPGGPDGLLAPMIFETASGIRMIIMPMRNL